MHSRERVVVLTFLSGKGHGCLFDTASGALEAALRAAPLTPPLSHKGRGSADAVPGGSKTFQKREADQIFHIPCRYRPLSPCGRGSG